MIWAESREPYTFNREGFIVEAVTLMLDHQRQVTVKLRGV
jgi:hypothetical protein